MTNHQPPLTEQHLALGAKMAPFSGWAMPLEYTGVLKEHAAVRQAVGVFDVSHLGKLRVTGPGAAAYLNTRLANDLTRIAPGQAQYTLMCNQAGGVIDDLIAYLFTPDDVLLIPNAANTAAVAHQLADALPAPINITNQHKDYVVLAIQGPRSPGVLEALNLPTNMAYMAFAEATFTGTAITVCRTGYTGEMGYELVAPNAVAADLWAAILAAGEPFGLVPCGLGARDTLRTEMGYPLHGQDISPTINPVEARLNWAIGWKKGEFDGASAIRAAKAGGPTRLLRGLKATGRGIPRPGMSVFVGDTPVGQVTSGTFSPTLRLGIALTLADAQLPLGQTVSVEIRNRQEQFEVVNPPFVVSGVK